MATDSFLATSQAAGNTANFVLLGGQYQIDCVGTGSVQLNVLGPDGATFLTIGPSVPVGATAVQFAAPGTYRFVVTTGPLAVSIMKIKQA